MAALRIDVEPASVEGRPPIKPFSAVDPFSQRSQELLGGILGKPLGQDATVLPVRPRLRSWGRQGVQGAYFGRLRTAAVSQTPQTEEPIRCGLSKLTLVLFDGWESWCMVWVSANGIPSWAMLGRHGPGFVAGIASGVHMTTVWSSH